jgi:hypothetical protein
MKLGDVLRIVDYGSKLVGPLVALGPLFKKLPDTLNPYFYVGGAVILLIGAGVWYYRRSLELPEFTIEKINNLLFITSPTGDACVITKSQTRRANRRLKPATFLIGQFSGDGSIADQNATVTVEHKNNKVTHTFSLANPFSQDGITYDPVKRQIDGLLDLVETGDHVESLLRMNFKGAFCNLEEKLVSSMIEDTKELEIDIVSNRPISKAAWAELWYCDFLNQSLGDLPVSQDSRIHYTRKDLTAGQQISVRWRFA